jgi:hypothetical protein
MSIYLRRRMWYYEFWYKGVRYGPLSIGPVTKRYARQFEIQLKTAVAEGR